MISRRARFAIHGLAYLTKVGGGRPVSFRHVLEYLKGWSVELSLSESYVAKVFQELSKAGIVRAVPGRKGGYALARPASEITMVDVLTAIDGVSDPDCCVLSVGECGLRGACGVSRFAERAREAWLTELRRETLADLAKELPLPPGLHAPTNLSS